MCCVLRAMARMRQGGGGGGQGRHSRKHPHGKINAKRCKPGSRDRLIPMASNSAPFLYERLLSPFYTDRTYTRNFEVSSLTWTLKTTVVARKIYNRKLSLCVFCTYTINFTKCQKTVHNWWPLVILPYCTEWIFFTTPNYKKCNHAYYT